MPANSCHLRRVKAASQVAAVCFRRNGRGTEFLLVRTDNGKWTFPKGNIDPALGPRISAALEAGEEAGAGGITAAEPFHSYLASKGVFWKPAGVREFPVLAYLLEVERIEPAADSFRKPTWCLPAEARKLLGEGREQKYRREFERLVERALEAVTSWERNGKTSTRGLWTADP